MKTLSIDTQITSYYQRQSLSSESLERLRNLTGKPANTERSSLRMWRTLAMAATVALAFLAGVLFVVQRPVDNPTNVTGATADLSNKIAHEVALRHEQCKHTDFQEPDLDGLVARMENLDFALAVPAGVDFSSLRLKGGHYCVVNGQLALHASFIDANGNSVSFLETKATAELASLSHAMHEVDGIEIEMWQTDGVVMALARPVA